MGLLDFVGQKMFLGGIIMCLVQIDFALFIYVHLAFLVIDIVLDEVRPSIGTVSF